MLQGESNSITNQKKDILKRYADDNGFRNTVYYVDDGVDTFKSENELMAFKNIFNDWYARDTSKKIRAVFKAKGQSGKHLSNPIYGYKHSETDKNLWVIDDETAEVVRKIFRLCIDGYGPAQIARILTEEGIPTPTAYALSQGRDNGHKNAKLHRWGSETISHILEKAEYCGHTVNFRTHVKSYKNKKRVDNPKEDWLIFENPMKPLLPSRNLTWYRSFARTNAVRQNTRKSIRFRASVTVPTVERNCICAVPQV